MKIVHRRYCFHAADPTFPLCLYKIPRKWDVEKRFDRGRLIHSLDSDVKDEPVTRQRLPPRPTFGGTKQKLQTAPSSKSGREQKGEFGLCKSFPPHAERQRLEIPWTKPYRKALLITKIQQESRALLMEDIGLIDPKIIEKIPKDHDVGIVVEYRKLDEDDLIVNEEIRSHRFRLPTEMTKATRLPLEPCLIPLVGPRGEFIDDRQLQISLLTLPNGKEATSVIASSGWVNVDDKTERFGLVKTLDSKKVVGTVGVHVFVPWESQSDETPMQRFIRRKREQYQLRSGQLSTFEELEAKEEAERIRRGVPTMEALREAVREEENRNMKREGFSEHEDFWDFQFQEVQRESQYRRLSLEELKKDREKKEEFEKEEGGFQSIQALKNWKLDEYDEDIGLYELELGVQLKSPIKGERKSNIYTIQLDFTDDPDNMKMELRTQRGMTSQKSEMKPLTQVPSQKSLPSKKILMAPEAQKAVEQKREILMAPEAQKAVEQKREILMAPEAHKANRDFEADIRKPRLTQDQFIQTDYVPTRKGAESQRSPKMVSCVEYLPLDRELSLSKQVDITRQGILELKEDLPPEEHPPVRKKAKTRESIHELLDEDEEIDKMSEIRSYESDQVIDVSDESEDIQDLKERNISILKLPPFNEEMRKLIDYLQYRCPESLHLLHGAEFSICRRGDSSINGSVRMRLLITKYGIFAEPIQNGSIPIGILSLRNFYSQSELLELNGIIRGVPINNATYLLTFYCDEPRRVMAYNFTNVIERRAFGDMVNWISLHSYNTDCSASITGRDLIVAKELAALRTAGEDTIVRVQEKGDVEWSSFDLMTGIAQWKGNLGQKIKQHQKATNSLAHVEGYSYLNGYKIEVQLSDYKDPLLFHVDSSRLYEIFGAYCDNLMERRQIEKEVLQESKSNFRMSKIMRFLNNLENKYFNHCTLLARAEVGVKRTDEQGERKMEPAHFNLICLRINADRISSAISINLRFVNSLQIKSGYIVELQFKPEDDEIHHPIKIEMQFSVLMELYSFYIIVREILRFYGKRVDVTGVHNRRLET